MDDIDRLLQVTPGNLSLVPPQLVRNAPALVIAAAPLQELVLWKASAQGLQEIAEIRRKAMPDTRSKCLAIDADLHRDARESAIMPLHTAWVPDRRRRPPPGGVRVTER